MSAGILPAAGARKRDRLTQTAVRHGQTIVPPAAPQGEQPDEDGILRTGSADR